VIAEAWDWSIDRNSILENFNQMIGKRQIVARSAIRSPYLGRRRG
jgi:hypothetical protein